MDGTKIKESAEKVISALKEYKQAYLDALEAEVNRVGEICADIDKEIDYVKVSCNGCR